MSSFVNTLKRIGDYLVVGVALVATFVIGLTVSLVWGYIAFAVILVLWRGVTRRMVTCRMVMFYPFGVTAVSAAVSWIELADGLTSSAPLPRPRSRCCSDFHGSAFA